MPKPIFFLFGVCLFVTVAVLAQEPTDDSLYRLPPVSPASMELMSPAGSSVEPAGNAATDVDMNAVRAEIRKYAWRKGDFTVTPYGSLWFNTVYETARTNPGDYAFYVYSASDRRGADCNVDAKSTRLGLDVGGPTLGDFGDLKTGGKVEIDFQGQFLQENKASVLLRHAYLEAKNDEYRILAGQTWDVISPLMPSTIMYSVDWGAGNIGYRRAQLRGERFYGISDTVLLTTQGSMNVDIASDFPPTGTTAFIGDHSPWPVLEGRTALTLGERGKGARPITVGLSGHIGEQDFDFLTSPVVRNVPMRTWSANLDLYAPLTDRLGFQGEIYTGENLGAYLGGILQGVDIASRSPIGDRGGWLEVWYHITPRLHSHVGYTLDTPNRSDLSVATERTYNAAYWGNIVYDITDRFNAGFEVGSWRTLYVNRLPGESVRFEFRLKYDF